MKDRIVVGVDGSPGAEAALEWAMRLSKALDAEVVAVHAVGLVEAAHPLDQSAEAWRAGVRELTEHQWCARLVDAGVAHRIEVVDGDAVDVLLHVAEREQAALVVMGARGVGGRPELALGSTSLRVLQAARVPALVVPDAAPAGMGASGLRHVLVGIDRSPASLAALEVAAELTGMLGGSLSVVEAFDFDPPFPLGPSAAETSRGEEHALQRTAAAVEELVRQIRERGVAVQVVVRSGEPAATLLQVADDVEAELVVVGTRGGGDPADPLLGSVARSVVAHGRRPTLVVPAAAGPVRLTVDAAGPGHTA
jgi:nucleotide-binding universal stress UspA family protein